MKPTRKSPNEAKEMISLNKSDSILNDSSSGCLWVIYQRTEMDKNHAKPTKPTIVPETKSPFLPLTNPKISNIIEATNSKRAASQDGLIVEPK